MPNNNQQQRTRSPLSSRYGHRGQCTPDRESCRHCFRYWCGNCGRGLSGMWETCYMCYEEEPVQEEPVQEEPVQEEPVQEEEPQLIAPSPLMASRYWHEGQCTPDSDRCDRCFRYWCGRCGIGLSGMMSRCGRCN